MLLCIFPVKEKESYTLSFFIFSICALVPFDLLTLFCVVCLYLKVLPLATQTLQKKRKNKKRHKLFLFIKERRTIENLFKDNYFVSVCPYVRVFVLIYCIVFGFHCCLLVLLAFADN